MNLAQITDELVTAVDGLSFGPPVTHVYNPLVYARQPWNAYCDKYGQGPREVLLLGMNPGPWGMAQVGVPFGEISFVRDWMGIDAPVGRPPREHPKRPIDGFECGRSEVSGSRLWGWARDSCGAADDFFARFFVFSYCPLVFMEDSGRNRVPEKLPAAERAPLFSACDAALRQTVLHFAPRHVLGVGKFAEKRARAVLADLDVHVAAAPHPSPASPLANTGWAPLMDQAMRLAGITPEGTT